jgi:protein-disulfide isomerase
MTTPLDVSTGRLSVPVTEDDHIRGQAGAPVTLVEYGDYQCPYCRAAHPIVQDLLAARPDAVRLVYRHFPLTNVHPYADMAAEVAADVDSHRHGDRIRRDFVGGIRSGVNGTPTFYVDGIRHDGDYSLDTLLDVVDRVESSR